MGFWKNGTYSRDTAPAIAIRKIRCRISVGIMGVKSAVFELATIDTVDSVLRCKGPRPTLYVGDYPFSRILYAVPGSTNLEYKD